MLRALIATAYSFANRLAKDAPRPGADTDHDCNGFSFGFCHGNLRLCGRCVFRDFISFAVKDRFFARVFRNLLATQLPHGICDQFWIIAHGENRAARAIGWRG